MDTKLASKGDGAEEVLESQDGGPEEYVQRVEKGKGKTKEEKGSDDDVLINNNNNNNEESGYADQVFSVLGRLYVTGKATIDARLPETAAKKLIEIENAVDFKAISQAIDGKIDETVDYVKTTTVAVKTKVDGKIDETVALVRNTTCAVKDKVVDSTTKRVEEIANRPVVKDLVAPVTSAVVSGMLQAGDVIVDYALPEDGEEKEDGKVEASRLAEKITTRVRNRAVSVTERVSKRVAEKKAEIYSGVESVSKKVSEKKAEIYSGVESATAAFDARKNKLQVDLIAYAKGFLSDEYIKAGRSIVESPQKISKEKLDALHKFASAVVEPYRQRLKGEWESKISPVYLAVSDYGEYFMDSVRDYETGSKLDDAADAANTDVIVNQNAVNKFISKVAHTIVEPALVRTVAVFMVVGDEMRRIKVQKIEPSVDSAKKQVTKTMSDVADKARAMIAQGKTVDREELVAGLKKRIDGSLVKFEEFKAKLKAHIGTEFDAIVQPVQKKLFAAVQALPWSGENAVTIESLRVAAVEKIGAEYAKYEKHITPLVAKLHQAILATDEFITPWYDALKKTAFGAEARLKKEA